MTEQDRIRLQTMVAHGVPAISDFDDAELITGIRRDGLVHLEKVKHLKALGRPTPDAELTSNALGFNVLTAHQKNFNYFIKSHADRFQRFIIPSGVMKMNETLTDGNSDCTETNKLRASAYFGAGVTTIESWLQQGIVVEHLDEVDQMDTTMPNDKMRGSHRYGGGLPQRDDHHES